MATGNLIGGIALLLYSIFVIYIGIKTPERMMKIVKRKMFNCSDKTAQIICIVFGILAFIGAGVVFYFGIINA